MNDRRPLPELGGKRFYDHGVSYSPVVKRQKYDSVLPHFLRDFRPCFPPQGDSRTSELAQVNPSSQARVNLNNVEKKSLEELGIKASVKGNNKLTKGRSKLIRAPLCSKIFMPPTIRTVVYPVLDFTSDSGDSFSRVFSPRCGGEKANSLFPSKFKQMKVDAEDFGPKIGTSYENGSKQRLSGDGTDTNKLMEPNPLENKSHALAIKAMDAVSRKSRNFLLVKESNNQTSSLLRLDLDRVKVCKALNLFDDAYNKLFQQRAKLERSNIFQIPLEAAGIAKQQLKLFGANEKVIGSVPGVKVGDQFRFRAQLVLIGLHSQYSFGIDYMKKDGKKVAISIVDSGRYAKRKSSDQYTQEIESSDVFFYSGQGGNPKVLSGKNTSPKEPEDQKLEGRNLALINSMGRKIPVRVLRKLERLHGKTQAFSYDGLYLVTNCTQERGPFGKLIFKFRFEKLHEQLGLFKCLIGTLEKSKLQPDRYIVDSDISQGKEKIPIRALNVIDNEKPPHLKYVTKMFYANKLDEAPSCCGCDCINGCSDDNPCSCLIKNGGEIPFNEKGTLLEAKSIVYECGPSCKCPPSCKNKVSQNGVRYMLEIFKTESKGWGVRSRSFITRGSFVCEYAGEVLTEKEVEKRTNNDEYLYDLGTSSKRTDEDGFTIDAAEYGNVGRFINHSCEPNLFAQDVVYDHEDKRRPHVMFFASKNILPLQEFSFDYNYKIDQVHDANGNVKIKECFCGARDCIGRMY